MAPSNFSLMGTNCGLSCSNRADQLSLLPQVKLDKKKVRFPKMKFKGSFHPTVIRKASDQTKPEAEAVKASGEVDPPTSTSNPMPPNPAPVAEAGSGIREPKYEVKYRHSSDVEDTALCQVTAFNLLRLSILPYETSSIAQPILQILNQAF